MKKTIVALLATVVFAGGAFAQGTITFANTASTLVTKWTTPTDATLVNVTANAGKVELLWAPLGTTDLGLFVSAGATANINPAGRYVGGTRTVNVSQAGGGVAVVVRGWTGAFTTYADAYNAALLDTTVMVGYSSIFSMAATGNPTTTPAGTPIALSTATGFSGFTVTPVPEPSSMALAGLGAASLLIFRRRK